MTGKPKQLSETDFSEVQHYLDCLQRSATEAERQRYADIILELLDALPPPLNSQSLILEVARFAAWGGLFDSVAVEFTTLLTLCSGYAAAHTLRIEQRQASAEAGRKGGRPPNTESDAAYLAAYDKKKLRNPHLSKRAAAEQLAVEDDDGRKARTIEEAISRAQKLRGKPPFPR